MQPVKQACHLDDPNDAQVATQFAPRLAPIEYCESDQRTQHHIDRHDDKEQFASAGYLAERRGVPEPEHERRSEDCDHRTQAKVNAGGTQPGTEREALRGGW